jgi:alpha-amylase
MSSFLLSSFLAVSSLVASVVRGVDVDGWRSRSIYQVLTDRFAVAEDADPKPCDPAMGVHCGGSWRGIYEKLDYIQGMNFDAIWISPIVAQMSNWTGDGEAYSGYWQQNLYELNPSFGTEDDLVLLIDEIHKRGMLLMLDIVVNHMVGPTYNDGQIDYSLVQPLNDEKYFHTYCPSSYTDADIENLQACWLGSKEAPLSDLKTESQEVRDMLGLWIKNQVWKYGVDGLRIDAAINVPAEFFTSFMEAAGVFATSEVYTRHDELACQWSETIGSILNYPLYWPLTEAFRAEGGSMQALAHMVANIAKECKDPTVLGTFSEVCRLERFWHKRRELI